MQLRSFGRCLCLIAGLVQSGVLLAQTNSVTRTVGNLTITITDLGLLPGGQSSSARAINNFSQIVGMASDASFQNTRVIWENGIITSTLPNFDPSSTAVPESINNSRQVSGTEYIKSSSPSYGVYWDATGTVFGLPPIPGGPPYLVRAHRLNNSGQIAGMSQEGTAAAYAHAVIWQGNTLLRDLGFMGLGKYSEAYDTNDLGEVAGIASN